MNEEIKRNATEIVYKHWDALWEITIPDATLHAILSTKNTISVLEQMDSEIYNVEPYLTEQTEILKELESRI